MKKAEGGFSLVEALVALSLLAAGTLLFIQSSHHSLKASASARRDGRALALAAEWVEVLRSRPWEEAVAGCGRKSEPGNRVATALCTVIRHGETYYLDLTRIKEDHFVDSLAVRCTRAGLDDMRQVVLETAVERKR